MSEIHFCKIILKSDWQDLLGKPQSRKTLYKQQVRITASETTHILKKNQKSQLHWHLGFHQTDKYKLTLRTKKVALPTSIVSPYSNSLGVTAHFTEGKTEKWRTW